MPSEIAPETQAVCELPLFEGIPSTVVERLLARRHPTQYRDGEVIFQEGDPARKFFIILNGTVKIVRGRRDGEEVLLDLLKSGDTIAECSFCASDLHSFSAEAVTCTRLVGIDVDAISNCLTEDTAFASVLLRVQQRHIDMMMDQLEQMKLMTAAQRVALFMLRHAGKSVDTASFRLPYEKALIARLLGMNPESFSRVLPKLRQLGVLVEGRDITIVSVPKLKAFVYRA